MESTIGVLLGRRRPVRGTVRFRAWATVQANQVKVGGFTELGCNIWGQTAVVRNAYFDMLRADLAMQCWAQAEVEEARSVEIGREWKAALVERRKSDTKLVEEMANVAASLR